MSFLETIESARAFLERNGRVSIRALKREFTLADDALEELVEELVDVLQVATREDRILVWRASAGTGSVSREAPSVPAPRASDSENSPLAAGREVEAEHRQLTVMFCDLVGSTELSERLDAEALSEVVAAYQKTCAASIESFDGHIAQYLGDGVLVYFGYPLAHEDDPMRAIHAALRIVEEIPRLNVQLRESHGPLRQHPLRVRIAIHTGPVVVGDLGVGEKRERLALGETVNIAARLEQEAKPGSIVVSAMTRNLVRGAFVFEELGERSLKGVEEPVSLFRPIQATGVQSRLALAGASGLTPLVGREQQVETLLERWADAKAGRGQVVLLSGEAGMGKSRLIEVLREHVADEPHTWHEYRGSPYHRSSAFYPVIEMIERALMFRDADTPEERTEKLGRGLGYSGFPRHEILPLIADFLGLPLPGDLAPLVLSPEARRKRTLDAIALWPVALAQRQPMILVAEDLHWWDPSSLEAGGMTIELVPRAPILLVVTFRPDFEPPWPNSARWTQLPLEPLTHKHIEAMARHFTGGKSLPLQVRNEIVSRTDGVPLFVEELTKTVLESGLVVESDGHYARTDELSASAIPTTLRDSLTARLDRLGGAKELAQLAAVLGREFSHELLRIVSPLEPAAVDQALGELVGAGLLYQRGVPPHATYTFKHALIQEAAYQSLLKKRRREYNASVAKALEDHFPERVRSEPEILARHCEEGGLTAQAVSFYQRAGEAAAERSAQAETISYYTKALELLSSLPEGPERDEWELGLLAALGEPVSQLKGWGSQEAEEVYQRALELCETIEDTPHLAQVLSGLYSVHNTRSQLDTALGGGPVCRPLAGRVRPALLHHGASRAPDQRSDTDAAG